MPSPYEAILLGLAAWRVWHLIAHDDLTEPLRRHVTDGREKLTEFVECPYCLGWHLSLVVYLFWLWLPTATLYVCIPFALNAGVITLQRVLSSD